MKKLLILFLLTGCGTTSQVVIKGPPGPAGSPGPSGNSVVSTTVSASTAQCSNGGTILLIGTDNNDNGVLDTQDTDIQSLVLCNGNDGVAGLDASESPYTTVGFITPCGPDSSSYKEVLLLLEDGSLLASFSDTVSGQNTRFALIPDGSYIDTDSSACPFTISTSGNTRSISWSGGEQSWKVNN